MYGQLGIEQVGIERSKGGAGMEEGQIEGLRDRRETERRK